MTEWKRTHTEQFNAAKRGLRYMWPPAVTERWQEEYEMAVYQRGQEAKMEAIERGEIKDDGEEI